MPEPLAPPTTRFDFLGHTFELNPITGDNVRDVRVATGGEVALPMLLYSAVDGEPPMLTRLAEERPDQFCEAIWQLCKRQARQFSTRQQPITREVFVGALIGSGEQTDAEKALAAALPFFFRDATKRPLMTSLAELTVALIEAREAARAAALDKIEKSHCDSTTTGMRNSSSPSPAASDSIPCDTALPNSGGPSGEGRSTTTSSSA